ncbi:hypothetical protein [Crateriforma conspicua]|uniref:Uncharacterized protein n=1 Tax=Crateriforma conspicua TaxID=2527996 RepID=A0A5C5YDW1_9PLAN|nr:hypothetical protein [Crateriforma conspicua]QDV61263.1 hypothetical protein Mal65_03860 [Crateriforma conspicua]TWT72485.1 hypothetical protein Pan14r_48050 [Crateriforma conspicua]
MSPTEPQDASDEPIYEATVVHPEDGPSPSGQGVTQSKAAVLAVLFLVAGVFGVPLLWINKRFNTAERILWTVVVTIYTFLLVWIAYSVVMWSLDQIAASRLGT